MSVIDGKVHSANLRLEIAAEILEIKLKHENFAPKLIIIQVGARPDSSTYVRMKLKACEEVGILCDLQKYEDTIEQDKLLSIIDGINKDDSVHGLLVQLPLPAHLDETLITNSVQVTKDIDGFSELNICGLFKKNGRPNYLPCTPKGIMYLLAQEQVPIEGKNVVVCGRSDIVGSPISKLLEKQGGTVTVIHSKTTLEQKKFFCSLADIIVSAVGVPNFITLDIVKEGVCIIDVGTNFVPDLTKKSGQRMCGDVDYANCKELASKITPVPGGVGPMTVVMILVNVLESAKKVAGLI